MENCRKKIYKHYFNISDKNLALKTVDGFSSRKPFFNMIVDKFFLIDEVK